MYSFRKLLETFLFQPAYTLDLNSCFNIVRRPFIAYFPYRRLNLHLHCLFYIILHSITISFWINCTERQATAVLMWSVHAGTRLRRLSSVLQETVAHFGRTRQSP